MGNSDLSNSENILIKVDQNNLMYIDPNSVVDQNGDIQPRGVRQENLVMYANLEADLIPRTTMVAENQEQTVVSIARGTLNFLRKNPNSTGDGSFDTTWTDSFVGKDVKDSEGNYVGGAQTLSDETGQTFGIDSISIIVKGANFTPKVTINFIDVRGKTLMESPSDSPYKSFFHMPWPVFNLTLKGYYGKAIRYRLHMTKFNSRFNSTNGNFEITATFVGSTYAYLNDITLSQIINAPYMFLNESIDNAKFNTETGVYEKKVSKSSRGYSLLKSVYNQYKQKGLIPRDFPEAVTLTELGYKAESLDKILESEIFNEVVDMKIFTAIKEMDETLQSFVNSVIAWGKVNLSPEDAVVIPEGNVNVTYYYLSQKDKTDKTIVTGDESKALKKIVELYREKIKQNELFGNKVLKSGGTNFEKTKLSVKQIQNIEQYYTIRDTKVVVAIDRLIEDINKIIASYSEQKKIVEDAVEKKMNEVIKDPNKGFGFEPTVRNMFAVLLANADVYIKLMKDTHVRAFESADARKNLLKGLTEESKDDPIYPWPEVKKRNSNGKENVIAYPGEYDLIPKLQSNNKNLWPEVDFVENFVSITTNRLDTNPQTNPSNNTVKYLFETDADSEKLDDISGIDAVYESVPYTDKTFSSFLYELYERAKYITLFDSFNNNMLKKLADEEYDNIKESIVDDPELIDLLKKVPNTQQLVEYMRGLSFYERYPYFRDQLPTVGYLQGVLEDPYKIEKYTPSDKKENNELNEEFDGPLSQYEAETYRANIYPFNSPTYLNYLGKTSFSPDNFKFNGIMSVNSKEGFIASPINPMSYVKDGFVEQSLLDNTIEIAGDKTHILNTPYFHNQLLSDFNGTYALGKYKGSAYLLLNSLPFKDLQDEVTFNGNTILMSSLFREISSTHFVPYHLILKWGSIYHRYKTMINDGVDILSGTLDSTFVTQPIDGSNFFNNQQTGTAFETFTVGSDSVTYTDSENVGMSPFYQGIYHQIVNDYNHYDIQSGDTSFAPKVASGHIKTRKRKNIFNHWTVFTDNSKYDATEKNYTLLPCDGDTKKISVSGETYNFAEQYSFRAAWWMDNKVTQSFDGKTLNSPDDYMRGLNTGEFSYDTSYRKVIDLIATFQPKVLETFEDMFIDFATEITNDEVPYERMVGLSYSKFQTILKDLSVLPSIPLDSTLPIDSLIKNLKLRQLQAAMSISESMLFNSNLIKITLANPKDIDPYIYHGMAQVDDLNTYNPAEYSSLQLTTTTQSYIKLYMGEDIDNHYQNFFAVNDIVLNEESALRYRSMAHIYGGYIENGGTASKSAFSTYLRTNIYQKTSNGYEIGSPAAGADNRLQTFLGFLVPKLSKTNGMSKKNESTVIRSQSGFNMDPLKLEVYNTFKTFNDKWTAGNSIGQRLLMEEFMFLDKANTDIGDKFFLNIDRILPLLDSKNAKQSLYGAISMMIQGTGLDMRALPAYVNFYGHNITNKTRIQSSKKVSSNLFGTFLEVDYQESSPKVIIQLVGKNSSRPDLSFSKDFKFKDDSFDISSVNNNPVFVTSLESFTSNDLSKSNRVVAFEVSFGDQNQGIFKGIELDQTSLKNTSEGFIVLENLARSESGAGTYNTDVGLFDYYKQASYKCTVTCMGNVMIQPTMFFYLKNIPMFRGSYWITEVTHSVRNNNIETTFTGARIPYSSLPDPKESFTASYRLLFDKISTRAVQKLKNLQSSTTTTQESVVTKNGSFVTDRQGITVQGEKLVNEVGVTEFGIPYNGFNDIPDIQKVEINGGQTFRAIVVQMGGPKYPIADSTTMSLITQLPDTPTLKWSEIKDTTQNFYTTKFQLSSTIKASKIVTATTRFFNPKNGKIVNVSPNYNHTATQKVANGPVSVGPNVSGYGMGLSPNLMKTLGLVDGDVVYFTMS